MTGHLHHTGVADPTLLAGWAGAALVLFVLITAYLVGVRRRTESLGRPWSPWRTAAWCSGALLVAAAVSPPAVAAAHADPRGHMVQHLLLGMYAPLGLVLAAPVTVLLGASSTAWRRRVGTILAARPVHVLAHPVAAALLTTGGLYVLYLTDLYAASLTNPALHVLVAAHLLASGCLFTWTLAGPDPAPGRPGLRTRALVLVLAAGAHAFLAKWLFGHAGTLQAGGHDFREAAELAARWMYYGGDGAELLLATALFATWYLARAPRTAPRGAAHGAARTSSTHSGTSSVAGP